MTGTNPLRDAGFVTDSVTKLPVDKLDLDERELQAILFCLQYAETPCGLPNHVFMIIIAKLWKRLTHLLSLWEEIEKQ